MHHFTTTEQYAIDKIAAKGFELYDKKTPEADYAAYNSTWFKRRYDDTCYVAGMIKDKDYPALLKRMYHFNKLYKELFFEMTGIKLPKTDKATFPILEQYCYAKGE